MVPLIDFTPPVKAHPNRFPGLSPINYDRPDKTLSRTVDSGGWDFLLNQVEGRTKSRGRPCLQTGSNCLGESHLQLPGLTALAWPTLTCLSDPCRRYLEWTLEEDLLLGRHAARFVERSTNLDHSLTISDFAREVRLSSDFARRDFLPLMKRFTEHIEEYKRQLERNAQAAAEAESIVERPARSGDTRGRDTRPNGAQPTRRGDRQPQTGRPVLPNRPSSREGSTRREPWDDLRSVRRRRHPPPQPICLVVATKIFRPHQGTPEIILISMTVADL